MRQDFISGSVGQDAQGIECRDGITGNSIDEIEIINERIGNVDPIRLHIVLPHFQERPIVRYGIAG